MLKLIIFCLLINFMKKIHEYIRCLFYAVVCMIVHLFELQHGIFAFCVIYLNYLYRKSMRATSLVEFA